VLYPLSYEGSGAPDYRRPSIRRRAEHSGCNALLYVQRSADGTRRAPDCAADRGRNGPAPRDGTARPPRVAVFLAANVIKGVFVGSEHDVIVIGMGVGGEEVAGRTAEAGMDVLGVEGKLVGGECPYWGCIPSKMMVRAGLAVAEAGRIDDLAGAASVSTSWDPVVGRVREATADWNDEAAVERFEKKGGTFLRGKARIVGPRDIDVDGERFSARRALVIATGSEPSIPPIDGISNVEYWTNREAIESKSLPDSMVVLGGGPIGLELAQAFNRFGTDVTIVEMGPHCLPAEEPENGRALDEVVREEGMTLHTGVSADSIKPSNGGTVVTLSDGTTVEGERLLVATGRRNDIAGLGVAEAGLDAEGHTIEVDERLRAGDGIWAVGDVTGKGVFTHMAVYQGRIAAANILGKEFSPADYSAVPRVTFTDPEVASVGMSEAAAKDAGINFRTGVATTSSSARGWIHGPGAEHGVAKLVADADRGVLVGASIMGPAAGEVIGLMVLAIRERVPIAKLRDLIFPYPTFVRGIEDALRELASNL
jgi:pyruvate/2-oxoglutarate dehydrogenase complex dihydrolipoamide dehydrogenase (E3) component